MQLTAVSASGGTQWVWGVLMARKDCNLAAVDDQGKAVGS